MKVTAKFFQLALLFAAIIFVAFLFWDWRDSADAGELACGKLTERKLISSTGSFDSHSEGLIYIGDVVEFSVRVIYNHKRVEIKERSLQNFNLSPYKRLSQNGIETRKYSECSEKTISFTIQSLDVSPGSENRFEYLDSDDNERQPLVEYVKDGILGSVTPTYEAPFVAPLTDGEVHRISNNAKSYPFPRESKSDTSRLDITRFSSGLAIIFAVIAWIAAPYARAYWRGESSQDLSQPLSLRDLFPELWPGTGMPHERLTCAYFRIEKFIEFLEAGSLKEDLGQLFKESALLVFSGELSYEEESEILLKIRELIEKNWEEVVAVYENAREAWS